MENREWEPDGKDIQDSDDKLDNVEEETQDEDSVYVQRLEVQSKSEEDLKADEHPEMLSSLEESSELSDINLGSYESFYSGVVSGTKESPNYESIPDSQEESRTDDNKEEVKAAENPSIDRETQLYYNEYSSVRQNKSIAPKVIGGILMVSIILAVALFLSGFDIALYPDDSGIHIIMRDKNRESVENSDWYDEGVPPELWSDDEEPSYSSEIQLSTYPNGDGTTVSISPKVGEEYSLQEVYEKCIDSVVLVNVGLEEGDGAGTGIILSENGYIITNDHVIEGATSVNIELRDGREYEATLVGTDSQADLAVLKIEVDYLTPAEFGDSSELHVGDEVAAIGNPLGLNFSLSNGIVSALDRDVETNGYYMTMIQTNVAINEGNSGGALINMHGQVIGITSMKLVSYSAYSTIEGMAFAIPTSVVKPVVDQLIDQGYIRRPSLGIMCATLDAEAAAREGLIEGIYVSSIYEESDAFGKLQERDVIIAANGIEVLSNEDLSNVKNEMSVGDIIVLTIYRDGETLDVEIVLIDSSIINY